jgi:hypothetical protein
MMLFFAVISQVEYIDYSERYQLQTLCEDSFDLLERGHEIPETRFCLEISTEPPDSCKAYIYKRTIDDSMYYCGVSDG